MSILLSTDKEILNLFSKRLKDARLRKNMTQENLAKRSGIGLASIARFESGENISLLNFIKIVKALGLIQDFSELFVHKNLSIAQLEKIYAVSDRKRASPKKLL